MSLANKVQISKVDFKGEHTACPHCGFTLCWRHGRYPRKGGHRTPEAAANLIVLVPRGLCRNPSCGRSFCILPKDVLPYQRFFWPDFLRIAELAESGKKAYRIAAELAMDGKHCRTMEVGLAVIGRTLRRIQEFRAWLGRVAQELEIAISQCLEETVGGVLECMGWFGFTRRWFHALYPARIHPEGNPHNSALIS